uniref:F-box domain-containing protein n=1 Tax=Caenorhabditis brenneri TaxID=135651 RepID=B6VBP9_CAEBE|nr:hypothetical protein Cbre_JD19.001 [Caenorhabditis brenneri]
MTEFFKKNPIALRHCLLYIFLHEESIDKLFDDFCEPVGNDLIKKEEFQFWFALFEQGIVYLDEQPVADISEFIRNDKHALRVFIMYEWLSAKRDLEKTKQFFIKNRPLPVFNRYMHFCNMIGEDVMEYQEFDFWFYRFANGDFNLNFERDKNKKIYELMDMPIDIMRNIVEYLDIIDRMSLERTSQSLRLFSQDQKLFHGHLAFDVYECVSISFEEEHQIHYEDKGNDCLMEFRGRVKILRGVSFLKQALQDFKKVLENPRLYLHTLTISFLSWPMNIDSLEKQMEDALKFTNLLHVKHLSLRTRSMKTLLNTLPFLKPGYLTRITIDNDLDEATIGELVKMDQWRQAKYLCMGTRLFDGPLRHLSHFHKFTVAREEMLIDDVRGMKEILFDSPDFDGCTMYLYNRADKVTIMQVFGGPVEGNDFRRISFRMTEFLKKNPIALRHCLLYEFLQGKPIERAFSDFCDIVGDDVIKKNQFQFWFDKFFWGSFDDTTEQIDDMRDIFRNDKRALRVCVLYEYLNKNKKMKFIGLIERVSLKGKLSKVFEKYIHFCKVIGDDAMEYREFESWFYRFSKGKFDLNYERDKNKKIYELTDMPIDIMENIVEYLGIVNRSALAGTCRSFKNFVENQKLYYHTLELKLQESSAEIRIESGNNFIRYRHRDSDCERTAGWNEKKIIPNVLYWKQALQDFKGILNYPKLHLDTLKIDFLLDKTINQLATIHNMNRSNLFAWQWEELLRGEKFEETEEVGDMELSKLNDIREVFLKIPYSEGDPTVNYDGHIWSSSSKNSDAPRHKPSYKKIKIFSETCTVIRCISFENSNLCKEIIRKDDHLYVHYFLSTEGEYQAGKKMKRRLTSREAHHFQELLHRRTTTDARRIAEEEGLIVSSRQASNQARRVESAVIMKTGPKIQYSLEEVEELKSKGHHNIEYEIEPNTQLMNLKIIRVNRREVRMFLAQCPTKEDKRNWSVKVDDIMKLDKGEKKAAVNQLISSTSDNFKFSNRMFVDTTFNVGGFYLTQLLGETSSIQTTQSKKNRCLLLAWMLHTDKESTTHEDFARKFRKVLNEEVPNQNDPRLTCIILDGEAALLEYSRILRVPPLRCDYHVYAQILRKVNSAVMAEQKYLIFGDLSGGVWKRGLFGSFDEEEFDHKLEKISGILDRRIFNWIKKEKEMILKCCLISAKLSAGHIVQYGTNNVLESMNGKLKLYIGKPRNLQNLVSKLDGFCNEEMTSICRASVGFPDTVSIPGYVDSMNSDQLCTFLKSIQIPCSEVIAWKLPRKLLFATDMNELERCIDSSKNLLIMHKNGSVYLIEDSTKGANTLERITTVRKIDKRLHCSCTETSQWFCIHLIRVLIELDEVDRSVELLWISRDLEGKRNTNVALQAFSGRKKSDRKGSRFSANNKKRILEEIDDLSALRSSDSSDEEVSDEMTVQTESMIVSNPFDDTNNSISEAPQLISNDAELSLHSAVTDADAESDQLFNYEDTTISEPSPIASSTRIDGTLRLSRRNRIFRIRASGPGEISQVPWDYYLARAEEAISALGEALNLTHHVVSVKDLRLKSFTVKPLLKILPSLKPGYLTTIEIVVNEPEYDVGEEIASLEQWKRADSVAIICGRFVGPLRHFRHIKEFRIRLYEITVEIIRQIKEILFKSPDFERCSLGIRNDIDFDVLSQEFGNSLSRILNVYHYPAPNPNEMTELLKNDPISLRYCLLYVFLQNKSVDSAYSNFCAAVGEDIVNKEEFYWHARQFNQGIFENNAKPVTNMRRILRKDKKALRVCVMYEWLVMKNNLMKMAEYGHFKNNALSVFYEYQRFYKVVGKFAMNYREFDFWFYRFVNGEFDLNFERDKEQKVYELADLPLDIMSNIVEYLDIFDRMSLEKTSQSLRLFSQDQKVFHRNLIFGADRHCIYISFGEKDVISYVHKGDDCEIKFRNRKKLIRGVSYLKQAFQDFKKIFENPKLHLKNLNIWYLCEDPGLLDKQIEDALKFTHLLHVQHISLRTRSMKELLNILPSLKPGYLTTITSDAININADEAAIGELVEMDQWKQAKYLYMSDYLFVGPLRHLYHFHKFSVARRELFIDDVREMKEILFGTPDFEKCTVCFDIPSDPVTIMQEFGGPIQGSGNICHYPIANSTDYFEIELERYTLRITRKKK